MERNGSGGRGRLLWCDPGTTRFRNEFDENREGESGEAEYREGQTLKHVIDGKALTFEEVCELGLQLAEAKRVVHRDIKPTNIFVMTEGLLKILR